MSCTQNCNQGRTCDCGAPSVLTLKDLWTVFGLGVFVGVSVFTILFPEWLV